ncbi:MAG: ADP-ribosylglycohydrolase family protein [Bacteroidales bacterium]|jgi:ADP-ribosylglycohydrolase
MPNKNFTIKDSKSSIDKYANLIDFLSSLERIDINFELPNFDNFLNECICNYGKEYIEKVASEIEAFCGFKQISERQLDTIKGVFYGQAIGDALGLGTEFLSKTEVSEYYPDGLSDYSQIVRDKHRSRWEIGDWTDDTDQFLCICNSIIKSGKVDKLSFANELYNWFKGVPMGIGQTVYKTVSTPNFTSHPHDIAEIVWKLSRGRSASNGAIMRSSILGTYEFWDSDKVIDNTEKIAKVTHWDNRCVGSCVIITLLISNILANSNFLDLKQLCQIADQYDDRIKPFVEKSFSASVEQLELDEATSIGYTLKALSAGLWAYFNANSFKEGLLKIINEGGDADTNGCVAGSILGAKFGFNAIPDKYIDGLIYKDELEKKFNEYIKVLNKSYMQQTVSVCKADGVLNPEKELNADKMLEIYEQIVKYLA